MAQIDEPTSQNRDVGHPSPIALLTVSSRRRARDKLLFVRHSYLQLIEHAKDKKIKQIDVRKVNGAVVQADQHVDKKTVKKRQPTWRIGFADPPHGSNQKNLRRNIEQ